MVQKWIQVTVRIPVDIETDEDDATIVYVTSPLLRGLLVAEKDEATAIAEVPRKIEDLACASAMKNPGAPGEGPGDAPAPVGHSE